MEPPRKPNGLPGRLHARATFLGLKTTLELSLGTPAASSFSFLTRAVSGFFASLARYFEVEAARQVPPPQPRQQGCCCCSLARLFWLSCCAAASSSGNSRSGWKGPNRSLPFPLRPPSSRALHGRARRSAKKRGRIHRASPPPLLSSSPWCGWQMKFVACRDDLSHFDSFLCPACAPLLYRIPE